MARVSEIPFAEVPPALQDIMQQYDEELGGSQFVQVFAHAPDVYQRFIASSTVGGLGQLVAAWSR